MAATTLNHPVTKTLLPSTSLGVSLIAALAMPEDDEVLVQIGDCRYTMECLYEHLQIALTQSDIGNALQHADDLALTFADHQRLERLAARRGFRVEPWDQRDAIDTAADLCLAHHPDNSIWNDGL